MFLCVNGVPAVHTLAHKHKPLESWEHSFTVFMRRHRGFVRLGRSLWRSVEVLGCVFSTSTPPQQWEVAWLHIKQLWFQNVWKQKITEIALCAATNDYYKSINCFNVKKKNVQLMSLNVLFRSTNSPKLKDSHLLSKYDKEKLQIVSFEKLEPANIWYICLKNVWDNYCIMKK